MRIDVAKPIDVWLVARDMRASDFNEFTAVNTTYDRDVLAKDLEARYGNRPEILVAYDDKEPIAVGGVIEARPNVGTLLFFATDEFPKIAFGLTRFIKGQLFPRLKAAGMHRIECVSMVGHDTAHRWIRALGLEQEAPPFLNYGRNKEAFIQFAWVSDDSTIST